MMQLRGAALRAGTVFSLASVLFAQSDPPVAGQDGGGASLPVRTDAPGLPVETARGIGDFLLRANSLLAAPDIGLKPPDVANCWIRVRTPLPADPTPLPAFAYTGGTSAITLYAPSGNDVVNGGERFDPVTTFLDSAVETAWALRIRDFWLLPAATRTAINRYFARRLLASAGDGASALRWPGPAKARLDTLENLPADHPLLQDRARMLDLFDRLEQKSGVGELVRMLNFCNDNQVPADRTAANIDGLLKPLLAADEALLPAVEWKTREPWPGTGKLALDGRAHGVGGEPVQGMTLRVCYGEQRPAPKQFVDWRDGGAPALLFRNPLLGEWALSAVEICARRVVAKAADGKEVDDSARRVFWVVVLDANLRELYRWPFAQSLLPKGDADWVTLRLAASPALPDQHWFLALEAQDPGPNAKLELCVRDGAAAEHCFRAIPGRSLTGLAAPLDFAVYAHLNGHGAFKRKTFKTLVSDLQTYCKTAHGK